MNLSLVFECISYNFIVTTSKVMQIWSVYMNNGKKTKNLYQLTNYQNGIPENHAPVLISVICPSSEILKISLKHPKKDNLWWCSWRYIKIQKSFFLFFVKSISRNFSWNWFHEKIFYSIFRSVTLLLKQKLKKLPAFGKLAYGTLIFTVIVTWLKTIVRFSCSKVSESLKKLVKAYKSI